jgi:hypothetical protein
MYNSTAFFQSRSSEFRFHLSEYFPTCAPAPSGATASVSELSPARKRWVQVRPSFQPRRGGTPLLILAGIAPGAAAQACNSPAGSQTNVHAPEEATDPANEGLHQLEPGHNAGVAEEFSARDGTKKTKKSAGCLTPCATSRSKRAGRPLASHQACIVNTCLPPNNPDGPCRKARFGGSR